MSLSPPLRQEIESLLEKHDAFESNHNLRVLFNDLRLQPWRKKLKGADTLDWRILNAIDLLADRRNQDGENGLVLLLTVLQERIGKGDADHQVYQQFIDKVKARIAAMPSSPSKPLKRTQPEPTSPESSGKQAEPSTRTQFMPKPQMPEMVMIPAGPFWMGSENTDPSAYDNEKPRHEVNLGTYWIGRYPVTNLEYAIFLRQSGYVHDELNEAELLTRPDHPVTQVNQADAEAYCQWLSRMWERPFRLPTEQEWEKAARGGLPEKRIYVWGNIWDNYQANIEEAGHAATTPVNHYEASNSSPYDVVDLLGNTWEWTTSRYIPYQFSPHDSLNFSRPLFVIRGGSWTNDQWKARISTRGRYSIKTRRPYLGFRLAADAIPLDRTDLHKQLSASFNQNELRGICLALELPDEEFAPPLSNMVRELVLYCERHNQIKTLVDTCQQQRPRITWFKSYATS